MAKIDLTPIKSGYNLQRINDNFKKIEDNINNHSIQRDSKNNTMNQDLDMDSNQILNARTDMGNPNSLVSVSDLNKFLSSLGFGEYEFVGDYKKGVVLTNYNQIVRDKNGEFWRASGKTSLPYTLTGNGVDEGGALVSVGDANLRSQVGKYLTNRTSNNKSIKEVVEGHIGYNDTEEVISDGSVYIRDTTILDGEGGSLKITKKDTPILNFETSGGRISDSEFKNITFYQVEGSTGHGTENNHQVIKVSGSDNSKVVGCNFKSVDHVASFAYGSIRLENRLNRNSLFAFNNAENTRSMGLQILGAETTRIVGNNLSAGPTRRYHAVRLAGYEWARAVGNVGSSNTLSGHSNAFSLQSSARLNSINSTYVKDVDQVILSTRVEDEDLRPSYNRLTDIVAENVSEVLVSLDRSHFNDFSITARNVGKVIHEEGGKFKGHNRYRISASGVNKYAIRSGYNGNHLELNLSDLEENIGTINGDRTTGYVKVRGYKGNGLIIWGSNCILDIEITGGDEEINAVTVAGDNNVIRVCTTSKILVTGVGNNISGVCSGLSRVVPKGNDVNNLNVVGFSGKLSAQLNEFGTGVLDFGSTNYYSVPQITPLGNYTIVPTNFNRTDGKITIKAFKPSGEEIVSSSVEALVSIRQV